MSGKVCQICGKPSGIYPLCKNHLNLKKDGRVIKNEDGKWIEITKINSVDEQQGSKECIICNNPSKGKKFCLDCYKEILEIKDEFDKNQKVFELKDYYFNLRSNIYRIVNFEYVKDNCKKLVSLAYLANDIYKDAALLNKMHEDIEELIKTKTPKKDQITTKITEKSDSQKEMILRTSDGT